MMPKKDPADVLIGENGVDHFTEIIQQKISMVEFKFARSLDRFDVENIHEIPNILDQVLPVLRTEKDPVIQRHFVKIISEKCGVEQEIVLAKLKKTGYNIKTRLLPIKNQRDKFVKAEETLIFLMAVDTELRSRISESIGVGDFKEEQYKALFQLVRDTSNKDQALLDVISEPELKKELSRLLMSNEEMNSQSHEKIWLECIDTVKQFGKDRRIAEIKEKLTELESQDKEDESFDLMRELQQLLSG